MTWQALLIAVVYGTAVSWFAQLLIERVPEQEPLRGKLRCGTCAAPLGWHAQFPVVGWMVRRGRCRVCGTSPGARRLQVELLCVLLTVAVVTTPLPSIFAIAWLLFVPVAAALWFIDVGHKRLPDVLTLPAAGVALLLAAADAGFHSPAALQGAFLGAVALFVLYFLMNLLTRGGMGMGDVKLALSIGALTGYLGWAYVVGATALGFMSGGALSAALLASRRTGRKDTIPFGPFMLLGAFLRLPLSVFFEARLAVQGPDSAIVQPELGNGAIRRPAVRVLVFKRWVWLSCCC